MTSFQDGPAQGQVLELRRSPVFLRVVTNGVGGWDALDQLDDKPSEDETIYVYELVGEPGRAHINAGRRAGGCRWVSIATYKLLEGEQPSDGVVRDAGAWRSWACAEDRRRSEGK
jgi:hypothetical protein